MHITTHALVLREVDYKETDKILTLFTETEGKLTVSARGCRKKGSPIAAGCQLLVWAEFTLYEIKGRWAVKETASERLFDGIRRDLDRLALASYFAEVTELLAEEGQPDEELLALALNSLHALDKGTFPLAQVKAAFEWRAMAVAGYAPQVDCCGVCGRENLAEPRFHIQEATLVCEDCRGALPPGDCPPLTPEAVTALRRITEEDRRRMLSFRLDPVSLKRLGDAGEKYIIARLERGFHTLDFYKSLAVPPGPLKG